MEAALETIAGDPDVAALAAVLAEPARARMLLALTDGRALPASLLAAEAGVAASTASAHLARLVDSRLVTVHPQGRHRYYRLAGADVAHLIETLAALAPTRPVRSLRQGTRLHALRSARTCYDHLAGRLGVDLFAALLRHGDVVGGDGIHRVEETADRLSGPGRDVAYRLTPTGRDRLTALGVELPRPDPDGTLGLRYCVDWTEQRHHLSGAAGRALTARLFELRWLERNSRTRAVRVTSEGAKGLEKTFAIPPGAPLSVRSARRPSCPTRSTTRRSSSRSPRRAAP